MSANFHIIFPDDRTTPPAKSLVVVCTKEHWKIKLLSEEPDSSPKELVQITITLPSGRRWTGTIQDFGAIFNICQNAYNAITYNLDRSLTANQAELDHLLSLWK